MRFFLRFTSISVALWALVAVVQNAPTAQRPQTDTATQDYSFEIPANHIWTDTGIDLRAGDRIHVFGPVIACGSVQRSDKEHLLLPSAPAGALLAKVDLEAAPMNASPDLDMPIMNASHLYLGVNGYACSGKLPVKVHIQRQPPPADKK